MCLRLRLLFRARAGATRPKLPQVARGWDCCSSPSPSPLRVPSLSSFSAGTSARVGLGLSPDASSAPGSRVVSAEDSRLASRSGRAWSHGLPRTSAEGEPILVSPRAYRAARAALLGPPLRRRTAERGLVFEGFAPIVTDAKHGRETGTESRARRERGGDACRCCCGPRYRILPERQAVGGKSLAELRDRHPGLGRLRAESARSRDA